MGLLSVIEVADFGRSPWSIFDLFVVTVTIAGKLSRDDDGPPARVVEVRHGRVESRLAAGQFVYPGCSGALRPWGWARPRGVHGLAGALHPRRARCSVYLVSHVLWPVTVLLRSACAVEVIGAALVARASPPPYS